MNRWLRNISPIYEAGNFVEYFSGGSYTVDYEGYICVMPSLKKVDPSDSIPESNNLIYYILGEIIVLGIVIGIILRKRKSLQTAIFLN